MESTMKKFSVLAVVLSLGLALATADAEAARRLGGGKSSGMQRDTTTMQSTPATPAAPLGAPGAQAAAKAPMAAAPAAAAAAAPAKRSWMGPIAGLAAGLGLAALASHFGFGEELANMLMIGLLVMAVLAVIGFVMRRRAGGMQPAMAGAGAGAGSIGSGQGAGEATAMNRSYDVQMPASGGSMIGAGAGSAIGAGLASGPVLPAGFDAEGFVRQAKVQFIRLQAANDAGNLEDIREFTTPEMFAEIQLDLQDRRGAAQVTEVVRVDAEVLEVAEEGSSYVVSVRFTGEIREDKGAPAEAFAELWHLSKPRQGAGGWVLAGIQQLH
jgi:predicted lipid-binding transport protein (Tim44 family)